MQGKLREGVAGVCVTFFTSSQALKRAVYRDCPCLKLSMCNMKLPFMTAAVYAETILCFQHKR